MALSLGGGKNKNKSSSTSNQSFNQTSRTSMGDYGRGLLENRLSELGDHRYRGLEIGDVNQWMNPYQQEVIDAATADINASRDQAANQQRQAMLARGALGGSDRRGIHDAELQGQYDRTLATTLGGLRQSGYNRALGVAQQEAANRGNYDQSVQQQINQLLMLLAGNDTVTTSSGTSTGAQTGKSSGMNFGFGFAKG